MGAKERELFLFMLLIVIIAIVMSVYKGHEMYTMILGGALGSAVANVSHDLFLRDWVYAS
jgi:lipoprotein signal peptidase